MLAFDPILALQKPIVLPTVPWEAFGFLTKYFGIIKV